MAATGEAPTAGLDLDTLEMVLESVHPRVSLREILAQTGWPVRTVPDLRETPEPTDEELAALRCFDPDGVWTG